jgi:AcrR family transcriptional regulator
MASRRVMARSGGRTEDNRRKVATAVLGLLKEGRLLFDVQQVSELSGVHRTTIRRRWPDRDALIAEAMAEHTSRLAVDPSGDWQTVLRRITFGLRDFMSDPTESALNRLLAVAESDALVDAVVRQWGDLFAQLGRPLSDAQARGEIRVDADLQMVVLSLASTMLTLTVYSRRPPSDRAAERLFQQALRGTAP